MNHKKRARAERRRPVQWKRRAMWRALVRDLTPYASLPDTKETADRLYRIGMDSLLRSCDLLEYASFVEWSVIKRMVRLAVAEIRAGGLAALSSPELVPLSCTPFDASSLLSRFDSSEREIFDPSSPGVEIPR